MERKIGLSSRAARAKASSPHGCQSTGLFACWSRYGLRSPASLLAINFILRACAPGLLARRWRHGLHLADLRVRGAHLNAVQKDRRREEDPGEKHRDRGDLAEDREARQIADVPGK